MSEDRRPQRRSRRPSSRATTIKVTLVSLTAAAALTGGLAAQMASGHDPALGAGQKASEPATKPSRTPSAAIWKPTLRPPPRRVGRHKGVVIGAAGSTGEHERRLDLFGTSVRVLVGGPWRSGDPGAAIAGRGRRGGAAAPSAALSRFDPRSELSALNRDPRPARRVSELTAGAIAAAIWAAERSSGLVDPTPARPRARGV